MEDDYCYTSPPTHNPLPEASSSSSRASSPFPPPFSSIYFAPNSEEGEEVDHSKVTVTAALGASVPAFAPPPPLDDLPEPQPESSVVADTKVALENRDQKGESSGKAPDDQEPPPPYTEGFSPLESFSYVMAAAGGAASIITQVQQSGGPPINTLGGMWEMDRYMRRLLTATWQT